MFVTRLYPDGIDIVLDCLCGEECNRGYSLLKPMGKYILYGMFNITLDTKSCWPYPFYQIRLKFDERRCSICLVLMPRQLSHKTATLFVSVPQFSIIFLKLPCFISMKSEIFHLFFYFFRNYFKFKCYWWPVLSLKSHLLFTLSVIILILCYCGNMKITFCLLAQGLPMWWLEKPRASSVLHVP